MIKNFKFLLVPIVLILGSSFYSKAQVTTTLVTGLSGNAGIAVGALDTLYVASDADFRIRKIDPTGGVSIFIGNGSSGSLNGTGTSASIQSVFDLEYDHLSGNLFFTQYPGGQVRKVTSAGVVSTLTTVSGQGAGLAIGKNDTLYTYSYLTGELNKIDPLGVVTFIANLPSAGVDLEFLSPDTLYLAAYSNNKIYQIDHSGVVTTLAGSGLTGSSDGTGAAAQFNDPSGVTIDGVGNLFVSDWLNDIIRMVTPAGVVTTFAGSGTPASTDGTGILAEFLNPWGIDISRTTGNLFVSERGSGNIRMITGGVPIALPLHWLSYNASISAQNKAQINWSVNETAVNNYQILKSTDAQNFLPITMVNSQGNGEHNYSFTEVNSLSGKAYYRIQQSDIDGKTTSTATMSLQNSGIDNTTKIYPTIIAEGFTIESSAAQNAVLSNMKGQLLQTLDLKMGKNYISTSHLPAGVYFVQTNFSAQKLIKY